MAMKCFGTGFERAQLVVGGEAQNDSTGAGFDVFLGPIDHFIPGAGDAQHGVGDRFIGAIVVAR
jgi:hypothetical protein